MDLKVPITLNIEFSDDETGARALLNLASGDIESVEFDDEDTKPWKRDDYEFTSGTLSSLGRDVEFKVDVNRSSGAMSVSANELLEIKTRAAALFANKPAGR